MLNRRRIYKNNLPYDAEIEYLLSDGYQIIDTGILAYTTNSYSILCRVVNLDTNRKIICGSYKRLGDRSLAVEFGGTSNRYPKILRGWVQSDGRNENLWTNTAMELNTDIDIYWEWDSTTKKLKIIGTDGINSVDLTSNALSSTPTASSAQTFWLFKDHRSSSEANAISYPLRIKYLLLYLEGILVRHFIPVRIGTIGYMFDKVTRQLFSNQGTGDFILGPDKPYDELLPSLTIASGQTPAIITDYIPNSNSKFVFSCKITERPSTEANKVLYGTFTYINNNLYRRVDIQFRNNLSVASKFGNSNTGMVEFSSYSVNTQYNFEVYNNTLKIGDITRSNTIQPSFTADYPLVLFSNCNNGTPSIVSTPAGGFVGTIYGSFDIYEGTTLMRSYHPAKKNGRVGLWESVTNQMLFSPYGEFNE